MASFALRKGQTVATKEYVGMRCSAAEFSLEILWMILLSNTAMLGRCNNPWQKLQLKMIPLTAYYGWGSGECFVGWTPTAPYYYIPVRAIRLITFMRRRLSLSRQQHLPSCLPQIDWFAIIVRLSLVYSFSSAQQMALWPWKPILSSFRHSTSASCSTMHKFF